MKALRFFFLSLLTAFAFAASAQTIEVYKDGRVIDSFSAAQVDSVVYKSTAAQPRYYYYAGWTKPDSEAKLAQLAKAPNGDEIKNFESMAVGTQIRLYDGELMGPYEDWFIVVPTNVGVYGPDGVNTVEDTLGSPDISSIPGYRIFTNWGPAIDGYMLKKK